jgi:hypothetical protein
MKTIPAKLKDLYVLKKDDIKKGKLPLYAGTIMRIPSNEEMPEDFRNSESAKLRTSRKALWVLYADEQDNVIRLDKVKRSQLRKATKEDLVRYNEIVEKNNAYIEQEEERQKAEHEMYCKEMRERQERRERFYKSPKGRINLMLKRVSNELFTIADKYFGEPR